MWVTGKWEELVQSVACSVCLLMAWEGILKVGSADSESIRWEFALRNLHRGCQAAFDTQITWDKI
jgi:hypothetical protein